MVRKRTLSVPTASRLLESWHILFQYVDMRQLVGSRPWLKQLVQRDEVDAAVECFPAFLDSLHISLAARCHDVKVYWFVDMLPGLLRSIQIFDSTRCVNKPTIGSGGDS